MELRRLGRTEILVTPVAIGCWPITGISSIDVNERDSLETLAAALDAGINFFDTAFCYGYNGESERMIASALGARRDEIVIATKGGLHWEDRKQGRDGSPAALKRECEESLRRLGTDRVELLYLHAPDPKVPIAESAGALKELLEAGKTRAVGLSNASVGELAVCRGLSAGGLSAALQHAAARNRSRPASLVPGAQRRSGRLLAADEGTVGRQTPPRPRI